MIVRDDIAQGTPEWFALKWGKIGGTLATDLFNMNQSIITKLVAESLEDFELDEDGFISHAMIRGIELEPEARRQLSEYIGKELLTVGWLQSESHPIIGLSPDGISDCLTIGAEIKCPGRERHTQTIMKDQIPSDNIHQCLHYFTVNPQLEKMYFCSFRPENKVKPLFVKLIERNTPIDLGWKIKGKINEDRGYGLKDYVAELPDIRTVNEWVNIALNNSVLIDEQVKEIVTKLNF